MTKVDAIKCVLQDNGGIATLDYIYKNICKYYPSAKNSIEWEAGIRGVLYRAIREKQDFKKVGLSTYALNDFIEEAPPNILDTHRMHPYIEGICVEIGNFKNYKTYTADPSSVYRDNMSLSQFTTLQEMPSFSYNKIIQQVKRIDVLWFNNSGLLFPQMAFEIVDSIGTLTGAFNRTLQLMNFRTEFFIVAPIQHYEKYKQTLDLEVYNKNRDRFHFISYDDITELYKSTAQTNKLETKLWVTCKTLCL